NPFSAANSIWFTPGAEMIVNEDPDPNRRRGYQLRSARIDPGTGQPIPVPDAYYRVSIIDDEPSGLATPSVPNFVPGVGFRETVGLPAGTNVNNPSVDLNNRLVIYSTGTFANAAVTLEGWVAFLPYPALSANDDINVGGSMDVRGIYGGIHSNANLVVSGGGW